MLSKDKPQISKGPLTKEDLQKVKDILDGLEKDPQAYDFGEPVDFIGLGLDDYPQIIKNPMDISTIRKNIKNNKYNSIQEILNDIQLIWDNCKLYNMEGSDIYKMAIHCEKITKKLIEKQLFKNAPAPRSTSKNINLFQLKEKPQIDIKKEAEEDNVSDNENEISDSLSLQEKVLVTDRIRKLSNEGLAALVRLIQKECSQAIEDLDTEKIQIRVDSLDRKTYEQINQLIDTLIKVKEINQDTMGRKVKA